jgi:hypothetical protein
MHGYGAPGIFSAFGVQSAVGCPAAPFEIDKAAKNVTTIALFTVALPSRG